MAAGSEVSDDAASWETVNDDEMDTLEKAQEGLACEGLKPFCAIYIHLSCKGLMTRQVRTVL
ncbi:hypothetical protein CFP56_028597 [Quercus suber]|uniref:Uncharacterized protein n=1 Tax=Quercus suber TaxID=58331 RepID=A0AAW0JT16_QUESU